ncbi:unnamed protein product [Amoebophrya sp. A25]|nr:unnamed protein product [Amoebophrya sp. A25]|eukprot:GSA25T00010467001.1
MVIVYEYRVTLRSNIDFGPEPGLELTLLSDDVETVQETLASNVRKGRMNYKVNIKGSSQSQQPDGSSASSSRPALLMGNMKLEDRSRARLQLRRRRGMRRGSVSSDTAEAEAFRADHVILADGMRTNTKSGYDVKMAASRTRKQIRAAARPLQVQRDSRTRPVGDGSSSTVIKNPTSHSHAHDIVEEEEDKVVVENDKDEVAGAVSAHHIEDKKHAACEGKGEVSSPEVADVLFTESAGAGAHGIIGADHVLASQQEDKAVDDRDKGSASEDDDDTGSSEGAGAQQGDDGDPTSEVHAECQKPEDEMQLVSENEAIKVSRRECTTTSMGRQKDPVAHSDWAHWVKGPESDRQRRDHINWNDVHERILAFSSDAANQGHATADLHGRSNMEVDNNNLNQETDSGETGAGVNMKNVDEDVNAGFQLAGTSAVKAYSTNECMLRQHHQHQPETPSPDLNALAATVDSTWIVPDARAYSKAVSQTEAAAHVAARAATTSFGRLEESRSRSDSAGEAIKTANTSVRRKPEICDSLLNSSNNSESGSEVGDFYPGHPQHLQPEAFDGEQIVWNILREVNLPCRVANTKEVAELQVSCNFAERGSGFQPAAEGLRYFDKFLHLFPKYKIKGAATSEPESVDEMHALLHAFGERLQYVGYTKAYKIQKFAIPFLLAGTDVVGVAKTGSGKTLAFLVPVMAHIAINSNCRALVMGPTRELVQQIGAVAQSIQHTGHSAWPALRTGICFGGEKKEKQLPYIKTANLWVGTPGRVRDYIESGEIGCYNITFLVLDEADRMLDDQGFEEDLYFITRGFPKKFQCCYFSATWGGKVQPLVQKHSRSNTVVVLRCDQAGGESLNANENVTQEVLFVSNEAKAGSSDAQISPEYRRRNRKIKAVVKHIRNCFALEPESKILIFVNTRMDTESLRDRLMRYMDCHDIHIMHGGLSQPQRTGIVHSFRTGKVLITTDVLSRGIDIENVSHVVNFEMPEPDDYVHRIGRTARGTEGTGNALTFFEYSAKSSALPRELMNILLRAKQNIPDTLERMVKGIGKHGARFYNQPDYGEFRQFLM